MTRRLLRTNLCSAFVVAAVLATACAIPSSLSAIDSVSDTTDSVSAKRTAAKPYALIFGTVYGPDQHPLPGVKVMIRRTNGKRAKWEHQSDSHGEFAQRVPAGEADYVVWAELKNLQASQKSEVKVHVENDERRDIALHLTE